MIRRACPALVVLVLAAPALAQQFIPLSVPGATTTRARAISSDGTAVVGDSSAGAWRWRGSSVQLLGVPSAGAEPTDVANQGTALAGINGVSGFYGFAWTETGGTVGLASSAGDVQRNPVINELGTTVLGKDGGLSACRWNPMTGVRENFYGPITFTPLPIGTPGYCSPGSAIFNTAIAATPDGSGGAGQVLEQANPRNSEGCVPGFCCYFPGSAVWTPPTSPHILANGDGTLMQANPLLHASRDFSRLLYSNFLWDANAGVISLSPVPSGYSLTRISGDGSAIIAVPATPSPTHEGMLWIEGRGYVGVRVLLTESGCPFDGWTSLVITGVNINARDVCGYGLNPAGQTAGWFATLRGPCWGADFDGDGDVGTDADIEAFFACLGGSCCPTCGPADFDRDGDIGTDADIEDFFRALSGHPC